MVMKIMRKGHDDELKEEEGKNDKQKDDDCSLDLTKSV